MNHTKPGILGSEFSSHREAIIAGRATCESVVEDELRNAARYNKRLNAFVTLFVGRNGLALSRARELDARRKRASGEKLGVLHGIPLAIKDNIFLGGFPTTAATYCFRDFVPSVNAGVVDDALACGAVPLGKTNLHEIALGATSAASFFGPVRNPFDRKRVSGGSSGGSAVAVAMSRGAVLGLGTDTGGSIRVPASLCGIVGFKPTQGSLTLNGVFPLSATLDHLGLLTRTVPDMAAAFMALAGVKGRLKTRGKAVVRVLTGHFMEEVQESVGKNFWRALGRMEDSGEFEVVETPVDSSYERYTTARGRIQLREAAWFYGEMAGSRDGSSKMNADVLTLLRRGMKVGEVNYMEANVVRLESIREFGRLLKGADALAMPTTRVVAPRLDEVLGKEAGKLRKALLQNTEVFNLCGFPALSIPSNPGSGELPTGIQLAGGLGEDGALLSLGERAMRAIVGGA